MNVSNKAIKRLTILNKHISQTNAKKFSKAKYTCMLNNDNIKYFSWPYKKCLERASKRNWQSNIKICIRIIYT